jgi:hypothetical protein
MGRLMSASAPILSNKVTRTGNLPSYKVDDSLIFLDREGGYCYALNATGARIWDLIAEPVSISTICGKLCEEFAVDRQTCEADVLEILNSLRKAELVR